MRRLLAGAVLTLILAPPALAVPIVFNDGQVHTIDFATTNPYAVAGAGTTLDLVPGGSIAVSDADADAGFAALTNSGGAILNISGGTITAGQVTLQPGGNTAIQGAGPITVSGGTITGGPGQFGGIGVAVLGSAANLTITGGTFQGGDENAPGGFGGQAVVIGAGSVATVSGGTFTGGIGPGSQGGPSGYSFQVNNGGTAEITGGNFRTGIEIGFVSTGRVDFFGTGLSFANGILTGTLANGDPINEAVYTVNARATVSGGGTEVSFTPAVAIPEPASVILLGLGLAGVVSSTLIRRFR